MRTRCRAFHCCGRHSPLPSGRSTSWVARDKTRCDERTFVMRTSPNAFIATAVALILQADGATAQIAPDACGKLLRERKAAAYLVAPVGLAGTGPIDLGQIPLDNSIEDENYSIISGYRVVVTPSSLEPVNVPAMRYGVELVKENNSVCPKANTYNIRLKWSRQKGELRPYRFEAPLPYFERFTASGYAEDVNDLYRFDARVIGEMVSP
jgi:hypothetical protein